MKIREKIGKITFPGWLFILLTVVYNEALLHFWTLERFQGGRAAAVLLFALGFGGLLGLICALIPSAAGQKWTAVVLAAVVGVVWLMEYFIRDAYQTFMTPGTIFNGAGGVAQDYLDLVISLLVRNLWRIALVLAPTVAYALLCRSPKSCWKTRGLLAALGAAGYLLGLGAVHGLTRDQARLGDGYEFDSAVRCFGLNMALTLEFTQGSGGAQEPAFQVPEPPVTDPAPVTQEEPGPTEPEKVYDRHVYQGVDFAALADSAPNDSLAAIYEYLNALEPAAENPYTGLFAGKNLILITAEAFALEVIDPERTPTLYRLANQGIRFEDYYQPAWGASTIGGEFSNLVGLAPTNGGMCMKELLQQDMFLTMGKQLQKLGYSSVAYHNHLKDFYDRNKTHVHLGYDQFLALYGGLEVEAVWPESDLEMMEVTVPQYIDKQPFSVYYMTVSGHCVYSQSANAMSRKNYHLVEDMDVPETVKCYYAAQMELEFAMESLVGQLEAAGIADDTVIVLATDHYPYGLERSGTWKNTSDYLRVLYDVEDYDQFIRDHSALIIWSGSIEGQGLTVSDPVYSLDILPTLSNLFGLEYDSRLLPGRDVFSQEQPLALWMDRSWKTDKGTYDAETGVFTPDEDGEQVDQDYIDRINAMVSNKLTYCRWVLETDFYGHLSETMKSLS